MKRKILAGLALLTSFSVYSSEFITQDYDVSFHSRYSDSRGKDVSCSVSILDGSELVTPRYGFKVIRVEAVGTGRWMDLEIPTDKLPLSEGKNFVIKSVTGDMRLSYQSGVLSYQVDDLEDQTVKFYKHDIADLKIAPDLSSVELVDASQISIKKSIFGRVKTVDLMNLKCAF